MQQVSCDRRNDPQWRRMQQVRSSEVSRPEGCCPGRFRDIKRMLQECSRQEFDGRRQGRFRGFTRIGQSKGDGASHGGSGCQRQEFVTRAAAIGLYPASANASQHKKGPAIWTRVAGSIFLPADADPTVCQRRISRRCGQMGFGGRGSRFVTYRPMSTGQALVAFSITSCGVETPSAPGEKVRRHATIGWGLL